MTYYTPLIILVWLSLGILCVLTVENDRLSKNIKIIQYVSYGLVALAALAEWLGVQLNGNPAVSPWLIRIVKYADYVLTPFAGGAIAFQFNKISIRRKILLSVLAANVLYQTISLFTGWMLTLSPENVYSHGPGYLIYIILYLSIILLVILEFAVHGKQFRRQNRVSLYATLVFAVTGIIMQEVLGGTVRTAYISLTICMAMLFIHNSEFAQLAQDDRMQEQMIRISEDPLTGIASRYAYTMKIQEFDALTFLPEELVVFSIDINGLKRVNDSFGHIAGDELICGASECISAVFAPYGNAYRTGGDEFIVFANVNKGMIGRLTDELEDKTDHWRGKEVESLSLSVGSAVASEHPGVSIERLVSEADKEMYKAKNRYYVRSGLDRRKI